MERKNCKVIEKERNIGKQNVVISYQIEDYERMDHAAQMAEMRNVYKTAVTKLVGQRPIGRPRRRWEDSIKMHLK
jgi:hypothetical protein